MKPMAPPFTHDLSPDFHGSSTAEERRILAKCIRQGTPRALHEFDRLQAGLSDYWYWFTLSTLWVNYSGWQDLDRWRRLFRSDRTNRASSLMKPSELRLFHALPHPLTVYRACRKGEDDWIAYTRSMPVAKRLATERQGGQIRTFQVFPLAVLALFLRRGEDEVIVLNRTMVQEVTR